MALESHLLLTFRNEAFAVDKSQRVHVDSGKTLPNCPSFDIHLTERECGLVWWQR